MKVSSVLLACAAAIIVALAGTTLAAPLVFAGRALPGLSVGNVDVSGVRYDALEDAIAVFEERLRNESVRLSLRGQETEATLGELGIGIDDEATILQIGALSVSDLIEKGGVVAPRLTVAAERLDMAVTRLFPGTLTAPQNASLSLSGAQPLLLVPSRRGERVHDEALLTQLTDRLQHDNWSVAIELAVVEEAADVQDDEIAAARQLAGKLLAEGLTLSYSDQTFTLTP